MSESAASLFAGLDIASAEIPTVKPGTYPGHLVDLKVGPTKSGDKVGMTLTYQLARHPGDKVKVTNWQEIPRPNDPKNLTEDEARTLGYLKRMLSSLGVPEARMNSVTREDLVGLPVYVTTKEGENGYAAFAGVSRRETDTSSGGLDEFAQATTSNPGSGFNAFGG